MAVDELGDVGWWGGDEGVCQVRRLAAKGGHCSAACKVSATQEQRTGLLPEIKIITKMSKGCNTTDKVKMVHKEHYK